jgi:DNA-directed RNA polymerase alpha subunit
MEKKPVSVELKADGLSEFTLRNGEMWVRVYAAGDSIILETNARALQDHSSGNEKKLQFFPSLTPTEEVLRLVLDERLYGIDMTARAFNGAENLGVKYIGQLAQLTEKQLTRQLNFGRKSLKELQRVLAERGLTLGMKFDWWSPPT